jgi:hypothetical protein
MSVLRSAFPTRLPAEGGLRSAAIIYVGRVLMLVFVMAGNLLIASILYVATTLPGGVILHASILISIGLTWYQLFQAYRNRRSENPVQGLVDKTWLAANRNGQATKPRWSLARTGRIEEQDPRVRLSSPAHEALQPSHYIRAAPSSGGVASRMSRARRARARRTRTRLLIGLALTIGLLIAVSILPQVVLNLVPPIGSSRTAQHVDLQAFKAELGSSSSMNSIDVSLTAANSDNQLWLIAQPLEPESLSVHILLIKSARPIISDGMPKRYVLPIDNTSRRWEVSVVLPLTSYVDRQLQLAVERDHGKNAVAVAVPKNGLRVIIQAIVVEAKQ